MQKRWSKKRAYAAEELWLREVTPKAASKVLGLPVAMVDKFFRQLNEGPNFREKRTDGFKEALIFNIRPRDSFKMRNGHVRAVQSTKKHRHYMSGTWWFIDVTCANGKTYRFRFDDKLPICRRENRGT